MERIATAARRENSRASANWFIGLPVSPGTWFEHVAAPPPAVRLFGPGDLHLTVAFLGRVGEDAARAAWAGTSLSLSPTDITFDRVVPMGSPRHWSALSILLGEGREAIEDALGVAREAAYRAAGAEPDTRPPKAHITVARLKRNATRSERTEAEVWAQQLVLPKVPVRVETIALYTWAEDRATKLFEIVEQCGLPRQISSAP